MKVKKTIIIAMNQAFQKHLRYQMMQTNYQTANKTTRKSGHLHSEQRGGMQYARKIYENIT